MADNFYHDRVLLKSGYIASDAPTSHPDARMGWKLEDVAQFYNPPMEKQVTPIELVLKRMHKSQVEVEREQAGK